MSIKTPPQKSDLTVIRIHPSRGWRLLNLRELWQYRELLYFLTLRDIKVRYKQTALGIVWVILQPMAMLVVFTLIFGRLAKMPSEGLEYPLFAIAALLPWQVFSRGLGEASTSLLADQRVITRVYFPRIMVPTATILSALVDFAVACILLIGMMIFYKVVPTSNVVWLPAFIALMFTTALGVSFWLSALNLEFRDVRYVLPFLTQFWLFLTPVVYPSQLVPEQWRVVYSLNPMVGVVEGFRWALFGTGPGPGAMLSISTVVAVTVFLGGILFFHWRERTFVDAVGSGGR
jgi:lipopolysaccharide transport system permease protein